ncbi:MAG: hypothetical protein FWH36_05290 [Lentimicrobiaceae bacterium]|nr:hypothetical protein [Lentimicrobiaceae bacterium]
MTKQEFPREVIRLLGLNWQPDIHTSSGGTVTARAWEDVYNQLLLWENLGILSIAKGLELYKK